MGIELSMTLILPYPLAIGASKLNHAITIANNTIYRNLSLFALNVLNMSYGCSSILTIQMMGKGPLNIRSLIPYLLHAVLFYMHPRIIIIIAVIFLGLKVQHYSVH
jgi:hypothetical protein